MALRGSLRTASFAPLFVYLAVSAGAAAQTLPILQGEFWVELEPLVGIEGGNPETDEEQIELLLGEAQMVFSGMVYGFEFRYVPSDLRREVAEEFDLDLLAEIPWGDASLSVAQSRYQSGRRYVLIRYFVSEVQGSWVRFWDSNTHPTSTAIGEGNLFRGRDEKLTAIRNGVKEAIRAYTRTRVYTKPREISGLAAFASVPYVVIDEGTYRAKVEVKLDIREVLPYKVY